MLRKLNQKAGFTLAETLVTILILLMVSSIVAGGIPAATNAYYKAVDGANAQVLLSTAATALRDELGTARDITVSGTGLTYYNRDDNRKSMISLGTEDILLTEFVESTVEGMQAAQLTRELVSRAAATARLLTPLRLLPMMFRCSLITTLSLRRSRQAISPLTISPRTALTPTTLATPG